MAIELKRMWEGGPLRQWSPDRQPGGNWVSYYGNSDHGFAGAYVCDDCRGPVVGVYRQVRGEKWLCKACHVAAQSRKPTKTLDKQKAKR